ncbi:unnamed protein product, partial [Staurois parvus]
MLCSCPTLIRSSGKSCTHILQFQWSASLTSAGRSSISSVPDWMPCLIHRGYTTSNKFYNQYPQALVFLLTICSTFSGTWVRDT